MTKPIQRLCAALLVLCAIVIPLYAQAQAVTAKEFVQKAAIGGMFEVQSSEIALDKSGNDDVKRFAQMMVDDYTRVNDELKSKMPRLNLKATTLPTSLDDKHQVVLNSLNNAPLSDFDRLYIKAQVDAHIEAVKLFKNYAKGGDDKILQTFASENLPTLQDHLTHIKSLQLAY